DPYTFRLTRSWRLETVGDGVGAVHIPGTPTGFDANSIMLACFNSSEDGEFGPFDRVALEYLY
ncbi:MAG: M57 family metalloprotease, partial [Bacteroidota bacterium]